MFNNFYGGMIKMESQTVKGIGEDFDTVKKQVVVEFDKAKAKISEAQEHAESYMAENPKKATAIAVGVGAAIGAAITAYMMKEKHNHNKLVDEKKAAIEQE
jgi:ElaB/YqjD/DUF883 family membrane-anchored ribosome-binding protein